MMRLELEKKGTSDLCISLNVRRIICLFFGILLLLFVFSGCSKSNPAAANSYPYKLLFNVTDVFAKTIDKAPYAVLTFDLSSLDKKLSPESVQAGDMVYVRLFELNKYAKPISYTTVRPDRGIFVEGRVAYVYTNTILVSYGFDTIKLPSLTSRDPSTITAASVSISTNGTAVTSSLVYRLS